MKVIAAYAITIATIAAVIGIVYRAVELAKAQDDPILCIAILIVGLGIARRVREAAAWVVELLR